MGPWVGGGLSVRSLSSRANTQLTFSICGHHRFVGRRYRLEEEPHSFDADDNHDHRRLHGRQEEVKLAAPSRLATSLHDCAALAFGHTSARWTLPPLRDSSIAGLPCFSFTSHFSLSTLVALGWSTPSLLDHNRSKDTTTNSHSRTTLLQTRVQQDQTDRIHSDGVDMS